MLKNLFILICLFFLNNCASPTSALLGPIFTGAKTGSIHQASISYGSNKIFNQIKEGNKLNNFKNMKSRNHNISTENRNH